MVASTSAPKSKSGAPSLSAPKSKSNAVESPALRSGAHSLSAPSARQTPARCSQRDVPTLWREFRVGGSPKARAALIHHYRYFVPLTVARFCSNLPTWIERADLIGAGHVGLINSVDTYDLQRKTQFETWAITKIRAAVLEYCREDDWVPRTVRAQEKALNLTARQLLEELRRPPTEEEIAARLNLSLERLEAMRRTLARTQLLSLDNTLGSEEQGYRQDFYEVQASEEPTPEACAFLSSRDRLLERARTRLPPREAQILQDYYWKRQTFKEISQQMHVSEGRVFQLHTQAVKRLHGVLYREREAFN